ncbi:hypothetical protein [Pseudoxanthomonas putridarboris]|uniref:Phosphoribosylanthranilate isomerase n=1 Tax=Pseudoxanthomonas putridarboris TaxID=752605 RepID=A0ABU9IYU9_9GAMM
MLQLPAFIAFTGVDDPGLLDGMTLLSTRYPIEWGLLVDDAQTHLPLFPDADARARLLARPGLRWAAHVCGEQARLIANHPVAATVDIAGVTRVQVNHGTTGSTPEQIGNTAWFGRRHGVRSMLQCSDGFPRDMRVDWLFDVSFGTGVAPASWPRIPQDGPFCGYSGGIAPDNVATVLERIAAPEGTLYWIDMESGVRSGGRFDLDKCEAVCRAVYG